MKFNYRTITVLLPEIAVPLRTFLFLVLILLMGVLLQLLLYLNGKYEVAKKNYNTKVSEYYYWSSVALQYPSIPDVLYDASLSAFNAGKKSEALVYIDKAIKIDPLFEEALSLREEILSVM